MSTSRPRVLYLAHTLAVGGAEEMVLNLVRHLPPRFEPAVMCIDRPGPIGEEVKKTGVPFSALGLQPGLRRPIDLLRLQQAIHESDATIVHTFLLTASLYGRFAAMLARVPIVIGTEVNIYERKQRLHRAAEGWLMRQTGAVIASAESVRDFYIDQIGADPDKVVVIYNAVDWSQLSTTMSRRDVARRARRARGRAGGGDHRAADRAKGAPRAVRRDGVASGARALFMSSSSATASCALSSSGVSSSSACRRACTLPARAATSATSSARSTCS